MATRDQIRQLVRDQTETETDDISDSNINDWIQLKYDEVLVARDWPFLLADSGDIAVSASASSFSLPADHAAPRELRWYPTGGTESPVMNINPEERPHTSLTSSGRPRVWWTQVGEPTTAKFWPSADAGGNMVLLYYKRPAELTGSAEPAFDRRFHRILVVGALIKVYQRIDQWEEAELLKREWNELLVAMDEYYSRFRQPSLYGQWGRQQRYPRGRLPFSWEQ